MDRVIEQCIAIELVRCIWFQTYPLHQCLHYTQSMVLDRQSKSRQWFTNSKIMLSAWICKPRRIGAPWKSCRNNFIDALNNVFQFTRPKRVDDKGISKTWTHIAKDEGMWNFLVSKYFESFRPAEMAAAKFCACVRPPNTTIFCGILTVSSTKVRNDCAI